MRVAIIGGGAAGALTAIHLRHAGISEITVYDPATRVGPGVAYAPGSSAYRLNVPAARLSVDPAEPGHFAEFAETDGKAFAPRDTYGNYLHAEFLRSKVRHVPVEVTDLREASADAIVLALGAGAPRWPEPMPITPAHRIDSVWNASPLNEIPQEAHVAVLGTGLSMMDAVLHLFARGHVGPISAISRTGRLPMPHGPSEPIPYNGEEVVGFLRAGREDGNWRGRMDALRPVTQRLWQQMSWPQRRQWISHARSLWDRYRHRSPADAHATVMQGIAEGRLLVITGDVRRPNPAVADILRRSDVLLNASGPNYHLAGRNLPILRPLIESSRAAYDPLGLGLMVDDDGRVLGSPNVWTLGALTVGCRWETTAIPEIWPQAIRIAKQIAHCV